LKGKKWRSGRPEDEKRKAYAGTMTAVYAWYPLGSTPKMVSEWAITACWGMQPETLLSNSCIADPTRCFSRMHLNNGHGATDSESDPDPVVGER